MVQRSVQKEALLLYGSQANLDEYNAQKNTTTAFWQRRNPVHMAPQFK